MRSFSSRPVVFSGWVHYVCTDLLAGRGLRSSTSQLNLSAFREIGGGRRGCAAHVKGALSGVWGVWGVSVCQTRLKLS